jgi:hypothetical protein
MLEPPKNSPARPYILLRGGGEMEEQRVPKCMEDGGFGGMCMRCTERDSCFVIQDLLTDIKKRQEQKPEQEP